MGGWYPWNRPASNRPIYSLLGAYKMKRVEFVTRSYPNFVQIREVEKFTLHMLNGEIMLTFFYASGAQEYKQDITEFKVIDL
jgi:hypothetical protein